MVKQWCGQFTGGVMCYAGVGSGKHRHENCLSHWKNDCLVCRNFIKLGRNLLETLEKVILYQTVFTLVCFMHQTAGTAWSHSLVADLYDIDMQILVPCYNKFTNKDDEYVENQAMCLCIYSNKHTSFFPIFFSRLAIRTYFLDSPCMEESLSFFHKTWNAKEHNCHVPIRCPWVTWSFSASSLHKHSCDLPCFMLTRCGGGSSQSLMGVG